MKNLVIVESPTKARTISKFLGTDYLIKFSMGHIIDLPKSKLGIDVDHNFAPQYEQLADKEKLIKDLQNAAKSADTIILATDPDREGEAIAANIKEILAKDAKEVHDSSRRTQKNSRKFVRIVFHEITEGAIKEALQSPRGIDEHLVDAQTARRVLDRLVGYQLSPILWRKVRRGLSAGRVQSVALRLLVEREREIERFQKHPYWTIHALLAKSEKKKVKNDEIEFLLVEINGEKVDIKEKLGLYDGDYTFSKTVIDAQDKADKIVTDLQTKQFVIADVAKKQMRRSPAPPFTTSTLQQEASRRFGLSGRRTMTLAQKLYEEGYITYHRTDSVIFATTAVTQMRNYIDKQYGAKYLSEQPRVYKTKQKLAQEAHEAIRPTIITRPPGVISQELGNQYGKLYELIWQRALASQMADALMESTTVYVDTKIPPTPFDKGENTKELKGFQGDEGEFTYRLKANGSVLLFDGFLKLNPQALQDTRLPVFDVGEELKEQSVRSEPHETLPPPRYNDASLIATLEEKGIGRPSTYASIISTLVDRGYVERVEKRFEPTPVGAAVNDFLVANFSFIDDIPFTAEMEDELDQVANGEKEWVTMMRDFYTPFAKKLTEVGDAARVKIEAEETDEKCPLCGAPLVIRHGKFGKFLSCSRFPDCKFTKPYVETTDVICPKDGGKIIVKKTKKGRKFFGCSNYPNCDFAAWKLEDITKNEKGKTETKTNE
jgi:DNA topoisomerase-1